MAPKSKSLFRQPGAKHFQLVHRSQRDPLIHDPESSKHVLKEFERGNVRKGKSRTDLEALIDIEQDSHRGNVGEAAEYGIYFDDTEYDYMQHLRTVGVQEDGVDSILVETPSKAKGKGKNREPIALVDIPKEALPSSTEVPRNYETQEAIPSSIAGFQPDMDPHLRQVLEALEDDAFVDDDLDEDFFGELVIEGEREPYEAIEFEFREEGIDEIDEEEDVLDPRHDPARLQEESPSWEARFEAFKKVHQHTSLPSDNGSEDHHSEGADTIGTLPALSVVGGKRRRKGTSDASGYSMSSSSMFRNESLTTLDERFDQIQRQYDSDEEEDVEDEDPESDSDAAPELITSREDFDAMMNEFLDNYEVLGGKMLPVLPGETPVEKLDVIRKGLGEVKIRDQDEESEGEGDILMPLDVDEKADRWDCETILTTHTNLENHPRLIRVRSEKSVPKIRLDPQTGLPSVEVKSQISDDRDSTTPTEDDSRPMHVTVTRPKNESKKDKKARKQAVKTQRQERRVEKKATKEQFSNVIKQEVKVVAVKEKNTKIRKL